MLGYFVGMVANTIPIPGAVSGGMVGVLLAFGVEADLALASVLSYRALAIWLPAPVGLAALGGLRRTVARWGAEGELAAARAPARRPRRRRPPLGARPRARAERGMSFAPARLPRGGHRAALLGVGLAAAALFAAVQAGLIPAPDLEGALTDLSDSLGAWTYALVGALAFLETGAFVGLDRAGRDGGRARRRGGRGGRRRPRPDARASRGRPRRWATSPPSRSAAGSAAASWSSTAGASASRRRGSSASRTFFSRHGGKAILIGRFIGLVRAVAPFLAGASAMRLRAFLPWSILGTGPVGGDLHARRLRVPRLLQRRRGQSDARRARARGHRGRDLRLARTSARAQGVGGDCSKSRE